MWILFFFLVLQSFEPFSSFSLWLRQHECYGQQKLERLIVYNNYLFDKTCGAPASIISNYSIYYILHVRTYIYYWQYWNYMSANEFLILYCGYYSICSVFIVFFCTVVIVRLLKMLSTVFDCFTLAQLWCFGTAWINWFWVYYDRITIFYFLQQTQ